MKLEEYHIDAWRKILITLKRNDLYDDLEHEIDIIATFLKDKDDDTFRPRVKDTIKILEYNRDQTDDKDLILEYDHQIKILDIMLRSYK